MIAFESGLFVSQLVCVLGRFLLLACPVWPDDAPRHAPCGQVSLWQTYKGTKLDLAAVLCCASAAAVGDTNRWTECETRRDGPEDDGRPRGEQRKGGSDGRNVSAALRFLR